MDNRSDSFFAFLLGAVVGVAVGLLYAPKTGKETRQHLKELSEDFVECAQDFSEDVKVKGQQFVNDSKVKINEFIEKGKASLKNKKAAPSEEVAEDIAK